MATQELQNIANAIEQLGTVIYDMETRSEFNGYTIPDSMGFIADAMIRIARALETKDTSLDDYANMQNHIVDLNKEEA